MTQSKVSIDVARDAVMRTFPTIAEDGYPAVLRCTECKHVWVPRAQQVPKVCSRCKRRDTIVITNPVKAQEGPVTGEECARLTAKYNPNAKG